MRNSRGFSILELILVLACVGLMAGITIPKWTTWLDRSREAYNKGKFAAVRQAISLYYADNGREFPVTLPALVPKYMAEMPALRATSRMEGLHETSFIPDGATGARGVAPWRTLPKFLESRHAYFAAFPDHSVYYLNYRPGLYGEVHWSCTHRDTRGIPYSTY